MDDERLEAFARDCLRPRSGFAYFGDRDLYGAWGFSGVAVHRDSHALDRSNWETIAGDFAEHETEDDFELLHSSHSLVGWMDELLIRVLIDGDAEPVASNLTSALRRAAEWHETLEAYPVADEEHYSNLERDDLLETLTNCYSVSSDMADAVASYVFEAHSISSADELREEYVEEALAGLSAPTPVAPQDTSLF